MKFEDLFSTLKKSSRRMRLAVVWPADDHTREAVALALEAAAIDAILIGKSEFAEWERFAPHGDHITVVEAANSDEAAAIAVDMARCGSADAIMKGMINTDNLLRAALNKEKGILPQGAVLTHVTATAIPTYHKILLFSDAAVMPYPTDKQREAQISYLASLSRSLGVDAPKVALVHCSEKIDAKHFPFTVHYQQCKEMAEQGCFGPCIIDGPLDVKTACNLESLKEKGLTSVINGEADALVFPDIEAANAFYKTLTLFAGAETAGILMGAKVPVVLSSRGDTSRSKFNSVMLASCLT